MSGIYRAVLLNVFFILGIVFGEERIDFDRSPMAAGKAALTENGFYAGRLLGTANFSPELRFPVRLFYNSAVRKSGLVGFGWRIPQLESSAIPEKDGVLWHTPWGEKIRFFEKRKPEKEMPEVFQEAMEGKGFFAPFADWEADGKLRSGSWTFRGKNERDGWKFVYRDAKLCSIIAPSGRSIDFEYSSGRLSAVCQNGIAFIRIAYEGRHVSVITINGVRNVLKYGERNVVFLPETPAAASVTRSRPLLISCRTGSLAPVEFGYDEAGYLNSIRQGAFEESLVVQQETEAERLSYLRRLAEAKKNRKNEKSVPRSVVAGRILRDANYRYSYSSGLPGKVRLTDRMNRSASYDFDPSVGIFKLTDFSGRKNTIYYFMRYDVAYNGKVRQIVDGRKRVVVSYRYDKLSGNVTRIRDMAKNDINFQYDSSGNPVLVEKRGADERTPHPVLGFSYVSRGRPGQIRLLNGDGETVRSTRIVYDRAGQPYMIDDGRRKRMIRYNRFGYPVHISDTLGQTVELGYDNFNRMVTNTNPFGITTCLTYNDAGLVTRIEQRDGEDVLAFLEISYSSAGLPVRYRDQRDRVKQFERDSFGRIVKEYFPDDTSVEYTYNPLGRLAQVLDQNRHKIRFDWNRFGLDSRTTAANQLTDYVYDKYGLLSSIVSKFKGRKQADRKIEYEYDDLDRVVKITYGAGEVETFRYDSWGKLIGSTKGGKSASYKYDYFGRLIEKTEGALVNRYAYNAYGQRTYRQTRNGSFRQEERRSYDRFGRLVKIESGNHVVLYRYNDRNQLESQILNGMRIRYEYTKYGQLKKKILVSQ